jgi:membrane-bound inhibitor of C-type lysozyme
MTFVSKTIVSTIFKAFEGEAKAIQKARVIQDQAIQQALDVITLACDKPKAEFMKGNAKTNPARAEVKSIFDGLVEKGFVSKASGAQYQTAFWIAFEKGVEFQRDLVNKKSDAKKDATPKSGKVTSTSRTDLDKTLSKALAQARMIGLTEFAATLLDHCIESLDGFKETVLDK